MAIPKRRVLWGGAAALLIALVSMAGLGRVYWSSEPAPIEIGVFFPATSESSWTDFVEGVRLAAEEMDLPAQNRPKIYEFYVPLKPAGVLFRWYPEVGSRGIQRRVSELCQRPTPPLALVGANNSSLTHALATELANCKSREDAPLLLMTNATADGLIEINPGRSFRFGYSNSYQAKTVVERLQKFYQQRGVSKPAVKTLLVQVLDDPFSVDLSCHFAKQLKQRFDPVFVPQPWELKEKARLEAMLPPVPKSAWSLTTSTGSFDDPTTEEWRLAHGIVQEMAADPAKQWVLVLPMGTTPYRRLSYAIFKAFKEFPDAQVADQALENLVVLSGDSMSYYTFARPILNQILPEETPAPVIFFSHVNPVDSTVSGSPNSSIPDRSLDREVVRALLAVIPQLGEHPSPTELAKALEQYVAPGGEGPLFKDRERHSGGGAIVAIPRPALGQFEILLPEAWQTRP